MEKHDDFRLEDIEADAISELTSECHLDSCFDVAWDSEKHEYFFIDYEDNSSRHSVSEGIEWLMDAVDEEIVKDVLDEDFSEVILHLFDRYLG